jgi:hypothetical protein
MGHYFRKALVLLIAGFLVAACSSGSTDQTVLQEATANGHSVTEINIDAIPDEVTEIGLSEFFTDFDVIRLESSTEALVENTTIYFADNFFLLGNQNFS